MPRTGATIYDLLLSCPGDIIDLKDIVKGCIEDFNRLYGKLNNINIELKHWSTDSYPQSGGKPQELLNNQFIHECDACVALFANKFGTPTDEYESGTEEEIEDMISSGKQVFLYFVERPVDPTKIDLEQLAKVRSFKEKYTDKGIYWPVKSDEEFRRLFLNHLTLYFLKLVSEPISSSSSTVAPKLEFLISDGSSEAKMGHTNFYKAKKFSEMNSSILIKIEGIKTIKISNNRKCINNTQYENVSADIIDDKAPDESTDTEVALNPKLAYQHTKSANIFNNMQGFQKPEYRLIEINEDMKSAISEYCECKGIETNDEFWYLGNLKKEIRTIRTIVLPYFSKENLQGTEDEKRKYNLFEELWLEIYEYQEFLKFFLAIDEIARLNCIISNRGTAFDEDIDVKIIIPLGCIVKIDELPIPGLSCIEEINESRLMDIMFCGKKTDSIDIYSDYPLQPYTEYDVLMNMSLFARQSATEKYESEKKKYISKLNNIFCYDYYDKEGKDVLIFNMKYLKQNTNMYLPSVLLFKKIPEFIEYEIRSRHSPEIIRGRLEPFE